MNLGIWIKVKLMECKTFHYIDPETKRKVFKYKKKYPDLESAIAICKKINKEKKQIHKVVSYKCHTCFMFHIGRNGKTLKNKNNFK